MVDKNAGPVAAAGDRTRGGGLELTGVCLGFLVVLFDATAVNVATGAIAAGLGASTVDVQWVLNAYTVAFAAAMLTAGTLGDRWGSRRVYVAGSLVFAVASAACAIAPTPTLLIAARAVQGLGAAAVVPCSLALISHRFPAGRPRSRALGVWGGVSGIGLAAGPVLGGALVSALGWRSVFVVVVPIAVASIALVVRRIPETPRRRATRLDLGGQLLSTAALVAVTAALTQTSVLGWSHPTVIGLIVMAVLLGAGFVAVERRAAEPMLPPRLFGAPSFGAATAIGLLFNFGLYGVLFCLALTLEHDLRLPGALAGLALLPLTAVVAVGALCSGPLTHRYGPRPPMVVGLGGGLVGSMILALLGDHPNPVVLASGGAVLGLVGLAMPAMTGLALNGAGPDRAALASAVLNAARQAGGALGVALLGSTALTHTAGATTIHLHTPMALTVTGYLIAIGITLLAVHPDVHTPTPPPRPSDGGSPHSPAGP